MDIEGRSHLYSFEPLDINDSRILDIRESNLFQKIDCHIRRLLKIWFLSSMHFYLGLILFILCSIYLTLFTCADPQQQPANDWKGMFSVSSYTQYFNVDTDIVLNRLISSLYPIGGDFSSKIDANPDLWVFSFLS